MGVSMKSEIGGNLVSEVQCYKNVIVNKCMIQNEYLEYHDTYIAAYSRQYYARM